MRRTLMMSAALVAAAVVSASCGSSTAPPGTGLTAQQQTALVQAIANSGALTTLGGQVAPIAVPLIPATGTLSVTGGGTSYDAVGIEIVFSIPALGTLGTGAFTGVLGWAGYDASTGTIDQLVSGGAFILGSSTVPGTGSYAVAPDSLGMAVGTGAYWNRLAGGASGATYTASDGTFDLTQASFGASTANCPGFDTTKGSCTYTTGSMSGQFNFTGTLDGGTGTWTQPMTTFTTLPAVKVTLTLTG